MFLWLMMAFLNFVSAYLQFCIPPYSVADYFVGGLNIVCGVLSLKWAFEE